MNSVQIAPTIQCADQLNLAADIEELVKGGADIIHADVMDGVFVPNLAISFDTVRAVKKRFQIPVDVHLMLKDPGLYIETAIGTGADWISFHIEAAAAPLRLLRQIRESGRKAGIVLNPSTPVTSVRHLLQYAGYVQLMAVEPGFPGQCFLPFTYEKVSELAYERDKHEYSFQIMIDGGINRVNGAECIRRGADILVAGALCIFGEGHDLCRETACFAKEMKELRK